MVGIQNKTKKEVKEYEKKKILREKNSIAGNRTRGTNVKGLYVTNYTTMDINSKKKKG